MKHGFSRSDARLLARLDAPEKIQDYLDALPINHERNGDTCLPVAGSLRLGAIHCIEGAFIAAYALWMRGEPPLLLDFQAHGDDDHVVALFRRGGHWGAISKSNHIGLRWRDPVYRSLRELAMSYFHEYTAGGKKTLRTYSRPFDLRRYDPEIWATGTESCWELASDLDESRHYALIAPRQAKTLRRRDSFERRVGNVAQYPAPRKAKRRK